MIIHKIYTFIFILFLHVFTLAITFSQNSSSAIEQAKNTKLSVQTQNVIQKIIEILPSSKSNNSQNILFTPKKIILLYEGFYKKYNKKLHFDKSAKLVFIEKTKSMSKILSYYDTMEDKAILLSIFFAYHNYISDISYKNNTAGFLIFSQWVYYAKGKMAFESNVQDEHRYRKLFYPYSTQSLSEQFKSLPEPRSSVSTPRLSDFQLALVNLPVEAYAKSALKDLQKYLATATREYEFLSGKTRVHPLLGRTLKEIDAEIKTLAKKDKSVSAYLKKIRRTSGYVSRTVRNSLNISMHALGLAIDVIPYSYEGKEAYWIWTQEKYPNSNKWKRVGLNERWAVPDSVVKIFEKHGFIWGGKWPNFDTIHFEYRPELIFYDYIRNVYNINIPWRRSKNTNE